MADEAEKYILKIPIRNMNDMLFAHLVLASNFGNEKISGDRNFGAMLIYTGHTYRSPVYPLRIGMDNQNCLGGIAELKEQAAVQRSLGYRYMHVTTSSSTGAHSENIDIDALLALDLDNMEPGKAYPISDRNWPGEDMSQDIPRLAVRKGGGIFSSFRTLTFQFGTLWGSTFEKDNVSQIWIYTNDIDVHNAEYWEQFRP
ncbi:MAG: hypothetical protein LBE98_00710 [Puniceicoccales bacterium]|nr:hypothetical protein [Puniceicoccales bacterium]